MVISISGCQETETPTPDPIITSLSAGEGEPGNLITITGEHFSTNPTEIIVKIGEITATVTQSTATSITFEVPDNAVTGKVSVTVNGKTTTSTSDFVVFFSPTISSISPESGLPGAEVTIIGENFSNVTEGNLVKFGEVTAIVTSATETTVITTVPEEAITSKITITVDDLTATSQNSFIVPPTIESFSPESGKSGDLITITGKRFSATLSENTVEVDGIPATVIEATETTLKVEIPYDATTGKISIDVMGGLANTESNLVVLPVIESINPVRGPVGSIVSITGSGFGKTLGDNTVTLNGEAVTLLTKSLHELTFKIEEGFTSGEFSLEVAGNVSEGFDFEIIVEAISFGSDGYDVGYAIAAGENGEYYVAGSFQNTLSIGNESFQAVGSEDIFIAKFNKDSEVLWAKHVSGDFSDRASEIVYHNNGIYVGGYISGNVSFDDIIIPVGSQMFITKLNSTGDFEWVKNFGGSGSHNLGGINIDNENNILMTGYLSASIDFGNSVTANGTFGTDVFVTKLQNDGTAIWATSFNGNDDASANSIDSDSEGNIFIGGSFYGVVNIGGTTHTSGGGLDGYIAKLDKNGVVIWSNHISGADWNNVLDVSVDPIGNCIATGYFSGTTSFKTTTLNGIRIEDIFIAKYATDGTESWVKEVGSVNSDEGRAIAFDGLGNIYVTGYVSGDADFGNETIKTFQYSGDVFLTKLDQLGNFIWTKRAGGTEYDSGYSISIDNLGIIRTTGFFRGFDSTFGITEIPNSGGDDVFVWSIWP